MMTMRDIAKLRNISRDDVLKLFGVESRRTPVDYVAPALGYFSFGVLVGAGIGLLFAPKAGRELRQDLSRRLPMSGERREGISTSSGEESIPTYVS